MKNSIVNTMREMIPLMPEASPMRADMQKFLDSIFCELPEANQHLWEQAQQIICKHLPKHTRLEDHDAWQKRIVEIWQRDAI